MTKAIVLAAGQGSRLRPITNETPKCLVPLCGHPLLTWQTAVLQRSGIHDIAVATGFCSDQISDLGYPCYYNPNFEKTNMVTSLFNAGEFFDDTEDLVVVYGDIVFQTENLQQLLSSESQVSLMIDTAWRNLWSARMNNPLDDAETLILDDEQNILEIGKKPSSYEEIQGQYTGLIRIRRDVLGQVTDFYNNLDRDATYDGQSFDNMYMTSFLQRLINFGFEVKGSLVESGWLEVDSCADLEAYESMFKNNALDEFWCEPPPVVRAII